MNNIPFTKESIEKNVARLTNQMWKLIPMREKNENWQKQLETVIVEIAGWQELFCGCPQFLQLLANLQGLNEIDTEFEVYRRTVFSSISLLQEFKNNNGLK